MCDDPLMTRKEAAQLLRVPVATMAQWLYKGASGPPCYRVGRFALYKRSEVLAWVDAQRVGRSA